MIVHCKALVEGDVVRSPRPGAEWMTVLSAEATTPRGGRGVMRLEAADGSVIDAPWGDGHVWMSVKEES